MNMATIFKIDVTEPMVIVVTVEFDNPFEGSVVSAAVELDESEIVEGLFLSGQSMRSR
jgi:hypothetical protein